MYVCIYVYVYIYNKHIVEYNTFGYMTKTRTTKHIMPLTRTLRVENIDNDNDIITTTKKIIIIIPNE